MKFKAHNPLTTLSQQTDLCLYLLKEELKNWKFFSSLRQAGLDGSAYQVDLSIAILSLAGLSDKENEILDFYYHLMEKLSKEMEPEEHDMMRCALVAYGELVKRQDQDSRD